MIKTEVSPVDSKFMIDDVACPPSNFATAGTVAMVTSSGTVAINVWHTGYTPNNISTINKQTFIVPELGVFTTVAVVTRAKQSITQYNTTQLLHQLQTKESF